MIRRAVISGLVMLAAVGSTPAMTMQEAAQINLQLAASICFRPGNPNTTVNAFRAAGFTETVQRSTVNSDTNFTFRAPAETVVVKFYYGEMPDDCSVSSQFASVTVASAILDQVIPQYYPGFLRKVTTGPVNPQTGQAAYCVGYEDPTNPIGLFFGVGSQNAQGCVDDGTSVLFYTYRV